MWWSWILTIIGLTGFILAGRKVWWCWYINIANQILWFTYAVITDQYGFIVASMAYTFVFTKNAIQWTRDRRKLERVIEEERENLERLKRRILEELENPKPVVVSDHNPHKEHIHVNLTGVNNFRYPPPTRVYADGSMIQCCGERFPNTWEAIAIHEADGLCEYSKSR